MLVAIDILIYITGHVSVEDIENHNAVLIAQDNTLKREYMGKGVKRIEITVFCKLWKDFHPMSWCHFHYQIELLLNSMDVLEVHYSFLRGPGPFRL